MRYLFQIKSINEQKRTSFNYTYLFIIMTIIYVFGIILLSVGLNYAGKQITMLNLTPVIILYFMSTAVLFYLRLSGYSGSFIPLIAMMLLLCTGIIVQTRLDQNMKFTNTTNAYYSSVDHKPGSIKIKENPVVNAKIISNISSYLIAFLGFIIVINKFKGGEFEKLGSKYMLLFAVSFTITAIFIILSKLFSGGKFLYSRVPWELLKVVLPIAFAGYLSQNGRFMKIIENGKIKFSLKIWTPFFIIAGTPLLLFILLGDYGQVILFGLLIVLLLFIASKSFVYPLAAIFGMIAVNYLLSIILPVFPEYIAARFDLWQNFWAGFPSDLWWDRSYQSANALFAVKNGGMTGTGLGLGYPGLVPLSISDFVFVEIAEELGFIGVCSIILLYSSIIITGLSTAFQCSGRFDFLAISALSMVLTFQVFVNIGGVLNIIPLTGIVLPFLSKGGFSIITFTLITAFIMAASHKNAVENRKTSQEVEIYER